MTSNSTCVLLVDDEESFLLSTAALLCRDGYACDCARDGLEAAAMLRNRHYDAMVSDIRMAGNARLELVRHAREMAPGMPVILVTGHPSLETAVESVSLPVTAYLTKPVDYAVLRGHVDQALASSHVRRSLTAVQEQLRECTREVVELLAGGAAEKSEAGPVPTVLVRTLASCLSELLRLRASSTSAPSDHLCELLDCPMYSNHRELILEAIEVLVRTKNSFKSKELGELRVKLERAVN